VVTATIQYGQTVTKHHPLCRIEADCFTECDILSVTAGTPKDSSAYTVMGGMVTGKAAPTVTATSSNVGVTCSVSDGKITVSSDSPVRNVTVTTTSTSAAGQIVTDTMSVNVYSQLVFDSDPTNGTIVYGV